MYYYVEVKIRLLRLTKTFLRNWNASKSAKEPKNRLENKNCRTKSNKDFNGLNLLLAISNPKLRSISSQIYEWQRSRTRKSYISVERLIRVVACWLILGWMKRNLRKFVTPLSNFCHNNYDWVKIRVSPAAIESKIKSSRNRSWIFHRNDDQDHQK